MDDTSKLTQLGSQSTEYEYANPSAQMLEVFPNQYAERGDYVVKHKTSEFTSLCPKTGQPDFATIIITFSPRRTCVESKSLKLYLFAFRNYGSFMETITNKIKDDLVAAMDPKWLRVEAVFATRGGIKTSVVSETQSWARDS